MAIGQMSAFLDNLRRAALRRDKAGLSDGQLLDAYVRRREEAAFAALVHRHGPMVWGVCRRVLGNDRDAEDAFQAAFLVLVRKAAAIVPRDSVANFLYGVARLTAMKARAMTVKRKAHEKQVKDMPEPAVAEQGGTDDWLPLLDEELGWLPDKYRAAIILCDLEGKKHKEAAQQLGCPEGTLSARLARGRAMLAKRLTRHGLAVTGGTLATVLSESTSASVPASVASSTIEAASLFAAGRAAAGTISVKVDALTESVLKAMFLTKLKTVSVMLLVVAVAITGVGAGSLLHQTQAATIDGRVDGKQVQSDAKPVEAGMATLGDVPEKVSGEVAEPQRLDLSGEWEMTEESNPGELVLVGAGSELVKWYKIRDEGDGRVRLRRGGEWLLGIYRQQGDHILINCATARDGRPTSFEKKSSHIRIIFRRVKPHK
ncbi:MAG TPA: sigma-70 family RNA polymerase sigma factor [Gemmataceae bacterium]|jgi:RNA polymerase sigma factor (sigma-70 family)